MSHSPAVYDSPRPSLPRVASRRKKPRSSIVERDRGPGRTRRSVPSGQPHLERAALEVRERPLERSPRAAALERAARRRARVGRASVRSTARSRPHRPLARHERRLVVERHALEPEPQRLPVDERGHLQRHAAGSARARGRARRSSARAGARAARPSAAAAAVLAHVDARQDLVPRLRERVLVGLVEPEERRDVQPLVVLVARAPGPRSTSGRRSPKVLFSSATMQASEPSAPVAPVEADRVEDVAEHAQLGEQQHALDRRVAGELDARPPSPAGRRRSGRRRGARRRSAG